MDSKTCSDPCESNLGYSANKVRPRRRRKTRSKFSSVNYRLDPNFDLRELLNHREKQETKTENVELNPRTMKFEKLVGLLHPACVLEYLQKILNYLTSSMTKISFFNIALYKEVLLLRLCQDKSNLNCEKFNEESKKVARQIMGVLKANQNVYEWTCKYDRGVFAPDVLVYEKVSTGNTNLKLTISNGTKDIGPLRRMKTTNANGDSNIQDVQTTPANKVDLLNTMYKFIKDSTRLKLEYPRVLKAQAEVLSSLINQGNIIDTEVGFGCKSLYAPLHAALDAHKQMYDFNVVFQEDSDVTVLMVLQKIQRGSKTKAQSAKQNSYGDHNTSKVASGGSHNSDPNKFPKQMTHLSGIGAVEETFIRASLREILHFMEDESRASLYFAKVTMADNKYLLRILQCFRNMKLHQEFTRECQVLLMKIKDIYSNANWRLVIVSGKKHKDVGLHNITMRKEPRCPRYTEPAVHVAPQSQAAHTATTVSTPRGTNTKAKAITFHSASHTDTSIDKDAMETQSTTDATKLVANSARKSKLLAAMSVPVESDVGERMMRLMGWRGGALGLRGEGITEPIMPPIHLAPGAGLGHVKQVKTTQTMCEFRCQFLSSVLSFLRSRESETTLEYTESLDRSKVRFVNHAIQNMKQRIGFGLSRVDEKRLLEEVFVEMGTQSAQVEGGLSSPDNRKIILTKTPLTARKTKERKRKNNPDSIQKNPKPKLKYQNIPVDQNMDLENGCIVETITEDHIDALGEYFNLISKADTPEAVNRLAQRLMFLTRLLHFLQMDDEKRCYSFDFALNKTLKSFISNVVMQVNKKAGLCLKCENDIEDGIYDRIIKATPQGCCLSCIFEFKKFTLQKKVYQKRFTNSAHDLPPPKSTDLKNTIIYLNNKVISCNDIINDGDDDDVILVENKCDIVVISDDEGHKMEVDQREYSDMPKVEAIDLKNKESLDDLSISIEFSQDQSTSHENSKKSKVEVINQKNEDSLDDSLISVHFSQDLSTSRETLLLETEEEDFKVKMESELSSELKELEQATEEEDFKVKMESELDSELKELEQATEEEDFKVKMESELDSELKELEQAIIDCDIICDDEVVKPNENSCVKQELETPVDNCKDQYEEIKKKYNSLIAENEPSLLVSDCLQHKKHNFEDALDCGINEKHTTDKILEISPTFKNENITEIMKNENKGENPNSLQLIKEVNIKKPLESLINAETINKTTDNSQLNTKDDHDEIESFSTRQKAVDVFQNKGKRSRSASTASEPESSSKRCKSQIRSVRITCNDADDDLNTDFIRKVQSVISESVDMIGKVDFHPRLECHGVKNGGLMYTCHDDKTFAWLTNSVVSNLDFNVTETDYPSETYKMDVKIYSFDDVDKILERLMLYNPGLDTSLWRVIDKTELEDFVIIKVEIDKVSYNYVNENNYSLFAGVDKAKFNVVWS